MSTRAFFAFWPYVALAIALAAFSARFVAPKGGSGGTSKEYAHARAVFLGGWVWRVSLPLLFAFHAAMLLAPRAVLGWNGAPVRLYLLEGGTFLLGGFGVGAWAEVMWRHMVRPSRSAASAFADSIFLGLLLVALLSGFFAQAFYRWGSSWGSVTLAPYLASLARGRPAIEWVEPLPFVVRLHLVATFTSVAALPFSRAALLVVEPLRWLSTWVATRVGRLVAPLANGLGSHVKRRAVEWIWLDEDTDSAIALPGEGAEVGSLAAEPWVPSRSSIVLSPAASRESRTEAETTYEIVGTAR